MTTDPWADRFALDKKIVSELNDGWPHTHSPIVADDGEPVDAVQTLSEKLAVSSHVLEDMEYRQAKRRREAMRRVAEEEAQRQRELLTDGANGDDFKSLVLTSDQLDSIPKPTPLIDDWLALDSLVRIYGPPKSLKSFLMLDIAGCIATGSPFAGLNTHQRKVLYVVAEGSRGIRNRVRAWEQYKGHPMTGVHFYPRAVQIGNSHELSQLIAYARSEEFGLIVFDTQARCTVGVGENDNTEMGTIVAALDVLREVTGACVGLVHHSGNESGRARGASAILGAVDAEFEVKRDRQGGTVKIITRAQKDMGEIEELWFAPRAETIVNDDGSWDTSIVLESTSRPQGGGDEPREGEVIPLDERVMQGVVAYLTEAPGATSAEVIEGVKARKGEILRAVRTLIERGTITTERGGRGAVCHFIVGSGTMITNGFEGDDDND